MSSRARIGVLGDLHGFWDDWDARYFSATDYDLLLFTGDLGSGTRSNGVRIARSIGRLDKQALVMPGNNDVGVALEIAAELRHQRGLLALRRIVGRALGASAGQVHLCGYSVHPFTFGEREITVVAARPYARGGGELSSPECLRDSFGIESADDSQQRLRSLVDQTSSEALIFLAHNGPRGLGETAVDLWGRDFRPEEGDWGDADLSGAIAHARRQGKRVLAVVAGHMHLRTRDGRTRAWQLRRDGTLFVNPARVPRIYEEASGKYRHHVLLELEGDEASAREVLVREPD